MTELLDEIRPDPRVREVREQLGRALLSAPLNTAEGNGKRQMQVRARFFDDARGSMTECAACLDALVAKKAYTPARVEPGKECLLRIAQMLTKLILKFCSHSAESYPQGRSSTRRDSK